MSTLNKKTETGASDDWSDSPDDSLREKEVVFNKKTLLPLLSHFWDFLKKEMNLFVDISNIFQDV